MEGKREQGGGGGRGEEIKIQSYYSWVGNHKNVFTSPGREGEDGRAASSTKDERE